MKIEEINIFKYTLSLKTPFYSAIHKLTARTGSIIELITKEGISGLGEIAPLPGLNQEKLNQSMSQFMGLQRYLKSVDLSDTLLHLEGEFEELFGEFSLFPSVQFGLESAILDIFANVRNRPLRNLLFKNATNTLFVNGLLDESGYGFGHNLKKLLGDGYETIKIKVGLQPIPGESIRIRELASKLPDNVSLRLDANRSWSLDQAVDFGRAMDGIKISYIEEPLRKSLAIPHFYERTHIPVALDESLTGNVEEISQLPEGIVALILKPGLWGGVEKTIKYARKAVEIGVTPIFSCPFYSGIGLSFIANLAAGFGENRAAMGLDTGKWFSNDLLEKPLLSKNGRIALDDRSSQIKNLKTVFLHKLVLE